MSPRLTSSQLTSFHYELGALAVIGHSHG